MRLPSHDYLDDLGISYEKAEFSPDIDKGAASVAHALGYDERQMIKTLIFQLHTGECILVMVGGDQNIVSGLLKKAAGSRNIRMADFETVLQTSGYKVGSIPPFSWQPDGFRTFLDVSLMNEPVLGVGTGVWGYEILVTPQRLVEASNAILVNLTDRDKPALVNE